ncbi:hypothetical protein QQF64_009489 [Cirrhinus molitorella]|uniref:Uncharacterized protein n=1 Tax=Cirrhinus molitorella TaxID=172907 RepID=A0ABR3M4W4_9TELE
MNDGQVVSAIVDRSSKVSSQLVADNRRPAGQGGHRLGQAVGPAGRRAAPINPNACPEEKNSEKKRERERDRNVEINT